jgi:hypothetical protein
MTDAIRYGYDKDGNTSSIFPGTYKVAAYILTVVSGEYEWVKVADLPSITVLPLAPLSVTLDKTEYAFGEEIGVTISGYSDFEYGNINDYAIILSTGDEASLSSYDYAHRTYKRANGITMTDAIRYGYDKDGNTSSIFPGTYKVAAYILTDVSGEYEWVKVADLPSITVLPLAPLSVTLDKPEYAFGEEIGFTISGYSDSKHGDRNTYVIIFSTGEEANLDSFDYYRNLGERVNGETMTGSFNYVQDVNHDQATILPGKYKVAAYILSFVSGDFEWVWVADLPDITVLSDCAAGHDWDKGIVTLKPTTNANGEKLFTCNNCGDTYTIVLPKLNVESVTVSDVFVEKLNGNKNNLTITVTEQAGVDQNGNPIEFSVTATFSIDNNAAGIYQVGNYRVYVDTKGNTQIRECYIVE